MKGLSASELERGWVEFRCPDHGLVAATFAGCTVVCHCRKRTHPYRLGERLQSRDIKALQNGISKSARSLLTA